MFGPRSIKGSYRNILPQGTTLQTSGSFKIQPSEMMAGFIFGTSTEEQDENRLFCKIYTNADWQNSQSKDELPIVTGSKYLRWNQINKNMAEEALEKTKKRKYLKRDFFKTATSPAPEKVEKTSPRTRNHQKGKSVS